MQRSRWASNPEEEVKHTPEAAPSTTDTTTSALNPESATFHQPEPVQASYAPVRLFAHIFIL
jgi:hypothetical protein